MSTLLKCSLLLPDYAVVIIVGIVLLAGGWWVISARKWFTGPVKTVEEDGTLDQQPNEEEKDEIIL
jgi:uncharacterized membrane protein